jgi:hypothetical protein
MILLSTKFNYMIILLYFVRPHLAMYIQVFSISYRNTHVQALE